MILTLIITLVVGSLIFLALYPLIGIISKYIDIKLEQKRKIEEEREKEELRLIEETKKRQEEARLERQKRDEEKRKLDIEFNKLSKEQYTKVKSAPKTKKKVDKPIFETFNNETVGTSGTPGMSMSLDYYVPPQNGKDWHKETEDLINSVKSKYGS